MLERKNQKIEVGERFFLYMSTSTGSSGPRREPEEQREEKELPLMLNQEKRPKKKQVMLQQAL
jgi:hypothetical protein